MVDTFPFDNNEKKKKTNKIFPKVQERDLEWKPINTFGFLMSESRPFKEDDAELV